MATTTFKLMLFKGLHLRFKNVRKTERKIMSITASVLFKGFKASSSKRDKSIFAWISTPGVSLSSMI